MTTQMATHSPNDTLRPTPRWGTQRTDAWWRQADAAGKALAAKLALLDEVDAAVDQAAPMTAPMRILTLEDVQRTERAQRDALLHAAADAIFGVRR